MIRRNRRTIRCFNRHQAARFPRLLRRDRLPGAQLTSMTTGLRRLPRCEREELRDDRDRDDFPELRDDRELRLLRPRLLLAVVRALRLRDDFVPLDRRPELRLVVLRDFVDPVLRDRLDDDRVFPRLLLAVVRALRPRELDRERLRDDALRVLRPRRFLRLACRAPRSRALAVSRPISLLKLLRVPSAMRSWCSSASLLSSNFWNHSSQLMCSSDCAPL